MRNHAVFALLSIGVAAAPRGSNTKQHTVGSNLCEHHPSEHDDESAAALKEQQNESLQSRAHRRLLLEVLKCVHKHDDECGYSPATRGNTHEFAMGWKRKTNQPEYKIGLSVCMKRVKLVWFSLAIALVALLFPYIDDITSASASALLQCFLPAWYSERRGAKMVTNVMCGYIQPVP